jgi:hypothetical protein
MLNLKEIPKNNYIHEDKGFRWLLVNSEPYVRKSDGEESRLFYWMAHCESCGAKFEHKTGYRTNYMPKKCGKCRKEVSKSTGFGNAATGHKVADIVFNIGGSNFGLSFFPVGILKQWIEIKLFAIDKVDGAANYMAQWSFFEHRFARGRSGQRIQKLIENNPEVLKFLQSKKFHRMATKDHLGYSSRMQQRKARILEERFFG